MGFFDLFRKKKTTQSEAKQSIPSPAETAAAPSALDTAINKYRMDCNFTVAQQREWLTVLNRTIPTIMLGEAPLCVDYFLIPPMLEEAGNMLNTIGQIAFTTAKMLSVTNLEKTLRTDSVIDLIQTYCILDTYADILQEPYKSQINTGKAYVYQVLKEKDLNKLTEAPQENKLYWAPAIYDGDPLVLEAPDYEIHVFPEAAKMITEGTKITSNGPIPQGYGFATKASGKVMHLRTVRNQQSGIELVPLFTDINLLLKVFTPNTRVSIVDYQTACRFCLQDRHTCSGMIINPGTDNQIIPVDQISPPEQAAVSVQPEPAAVSAQPEPATPAPTQPKEKYTYKVSSVSSTDPWIFIQCNEEDATESSEPFVYLVRKAAEEMNDGVWEGNILPAGVFQGDTRYRIKNDPLFMVFQYDTLFGIVLEYTRGVGRSNALNYLSNMLDVEVDEQFR